MADQFSITPALSERLKERIQRQRLGVETESTESFKSLMQSIASGQRAKKGLQALGKEPKPAQRRGILETLFSQQTGVLTAPFRAVTALGSSLVGGPETEGMNPLEAVYRSAFKGEFAVTGGDIFKVNDNDGLGERLAKYAGALAFDIALDPVSYVGPVNIFSKKGSAVLAVRKGESMLSIADDLLRKSGNSDRSLKLADTLFSESKLATAAEIQRKTGTAIEAGTPLDVLKIGPDGAVNQAVKSRVTGLQFGLRIGEAILQGGRPRVLKTVTEMLGSEKLAQEFMLRLPAEISGGLFLKNPFTGRPIQRILGGQGGGGEVVDRLNQARLALSASPPLNFFTEYFSGKSGVTYASVKRGLLPKSKLSILERDTLLDFVGFKKMMAERNIALTELGLEWQGMLSSALATERRFAAEADRKQYLAALETGFFSPMAPINQNLTQAQREGYAAAANIRRLISEYHKTAQELGIEVGDLGEGYSPLMLTQEAYERRLNRGYTGGETREQFQYAGGHGRRTMNEVSEDPDIRNILGNELPNRRNVVALNAKYANDRLRKAGKLKEGEFEFEENPLKVANMYLNWISNAIAGKRAVNAALETGAIIRLPAQLREVLNTADAASFYVAAKSVTERTKATNAAYKKLRDYLDRHYRSILDPDKLEAVRTESIGVRGEAVTAYRDAKDAELVARQELLRATKGVEAAADRLQRATPQSMPAAGVPNVESVVAEAQRVYNNARSRLSKAANMAEQAEESYDYLASQLDMPGPTQLDPNTQAWYDAAADMDVMVSRQRAKVDEELAASQAAREELDRARQLRVETYASLDAAQKQNFDLYEQALVLQQQASDVYAAAAERRGLAFRAAQAAKEDTTVMRAAGLDQLVARYSKVVDEYLEVKTGIGKPFNRMSPTEKADLLMAKAAMDDAAKDLKELIGYATRRSGVGAQYVRKLQYMMRRLSDQQLTLARVIDNTERFNTLMDTIPDFTRPDALQMMDDIYKSYKNIRKHVTPEDLKELTDLERRVLSGPFEALKRKKVDISPAGEELFEVTGGKVAKVGSGKAGLTAKIPSTIQDVFAPEGVRRALERLYQAELDPSEWQQWMSRIYDPAALVWKTGVTVARGPAYSFTNLVGALVNNFIARVSTSNHKRSAIVINKVRETLSQITKENPDKSYFELVEIAKSRLKKELGGVKVKGVEVVDLFSDFLERGGHFSTDMFYQMNELQRLGVDLSEPLTRRSGIQYRFDTEPTGPIEDKYRAVVGFLLNNPVQRSLNDLAQLSELFPRFAAFLDGFERFENLESAIDMVHMLHFDYQDLSNAEVWVKRLVPFYTWTRNNIPLQLRAAVLASDQVAKLYTANAELREAFEVDGEASWINDYLPDYMVVNGGFATYIKAGTGYLGLTPKLPMQDADRFFGTVFVAGIPIPWPRRDAVISSLGPVVKSPIEFVTNRNFELGYEYGSDMDLLQGQIRTVIPYYGTARRVLSALGLPVDKERQLSNLLNVLVGAPYGAATINEKVLTRGARNAADEYNKQLRAAAADAGVDVEWLRKQLQRGTNLAQLTLMIGSGAGSVERIAEQKKRDKAMGKGSPVPDYLSTIRELQGR